MSCTTLKAFMWKDHLVCTCKTGNEVLYLNIIHAFTTSIFTCNKYCSMYLACIMSRKWCLLSSWFVLCCPLVFDTETTMSSIVFCNRVMVYWINSIKMAWFVFYFIAVRMAWKSLSTSCLQFPCYQIFLSYMFDNSSYNYHQLAIIDSENVPHCI